MNSVTTVSRTSGPRGGAAAWETRTQPIDRPTTRPHHYRRGINGQRCPLRVCDAAASSHTSLEDSDERSIRSGTSAIRTQSGITLALVVGAVGIYKAIESMTSPALPLIQNELGASRARSLG